MTISEKLDRLKTFLDHSRLCEWSLRLLAYDEPQNSIDDLADNEQANQWAETVCNQFTPDIVQALPAAGFMECRPWSIDGKTLELPASPTAHRLAGWCLTGIVAYLTRDEPSPEEIVYRLAAVEFNETELNRLFARMETERCLVAGPVIDAAEADGSSADEESLQSSHKMRIEDHITRIFMKDKTVTSEWSAEDWRDELEPIIGYRCSKSAITNLGVWKNTIMPYRRLSQSQNSDRLAQNGKATEEGDIHRVDPRRSAGKEMDDPDNDAVYRE